MKLITAILYPFALAKRDAGILGGDESVQSEARSAGLLRPSVDSADQMSGKRRILHAIFSVLDAVIYKCSVFRLTSIF